MFTPFSEIPLKSTIPVTLEDALSGFASVQYAVYNPSKKDDQIQFYIPLATTVDNHSIECACLPESFELELDGLTASELYSLDDVPLEVVDVSLFGEVVGMITEGGEFQ